MGKIIVQLLFVILASSSWGHGINEEDFQNLLSKVEILTTSNEELRSRQDILEDRVSKLEELAKVGTLRTCAEYAQYGLKTSGLYMVDPDGPLLGHPPFQVFCNFDDGIIMNLNYDLTKFLNIFFQGPLKLCTIQKIQQWLIIVTTLVRFSENMN